jgi:integrase
MSLTDNAIRAAKPRQKPYKVSDEKGLYLLVTAGGSRLWRLKYRIGGREKLLSLGVYDDVSLKRAREKRDEARRLIADGIDPSVKRRTERHAGADTFKAVALEFLERQRTKLKDNTREIYRDRLARFAFPYLGSRPVARIFAPDVLAMLRRIESRGTHETAHRTRALCGRVFRYAVATGRAERDPTADPRGALTPANGNNFAAITTPARIGELMRAIDEYIGQPSTMAALKLAPLVFVRPGELRAAEWAEFDLDGAEWRIPAARMKAGEQHIVPLSKQAVAILRDLERHTSSGRYLFPSLRTTTRPISDMTINAALRRLGFPKDQMTGHGFRTMASTMLNEQGFPPDVIELQLAHKDRNKVRAAYNRSERLAERRKMMQAWADYLDGLRSGAKIANLRSASAG